MNFLKNYDKSPQSKETYKSKSPGSSQVSFHKQTQREKGIFKEQGESHNDVIQGKYLKDTSLRYKKAGPVPHVSSEQSFRQPALVPAQQGLLSSGRRKSKQTLANECKAMHRSDSSLKPYPGKAWVFSNNLNSWLNSLTGSTSEHGARSYHLRL